MIQAIIHTKYYIVTLNLSDQVIKHMIDDGSQGYYSVLAFIQLYHNE